MPSHSNGQGSLFPNLLIAAAGISKKRNCGGNPPVVLPRNRISCRFSCRVLIPLAAGESTTVSDIPCTAVAIVHMVQLSVVPNTSCSM